MARLVPENWVCIKADEDDVFKGIDFSKINNALLISFLEDSQGDQEHDDEQLLSMMRSLETEIHPNTMNSYDPLVEEAQLGVPTEDFQLRRHGLVKGQDCLAALDMEFDWIDTEISPYQPTDHMTGRYMEHFGHEMDGVVEFEGGRDYNSPVAWHVSLEEHGYNFLCQETHDSMV